MKYVTTPIYYTNGRAHIGHVYTTVAADVLRRVETGQETFLRTGVDEHGIKVQRRAEALQKTPQELCDENAATFRDLFAAYGVEYQDFIRTTSESHRRQALEIFDRLVASGDVYLSSYKGWYSVKDETYYGEGEVYADETDTKRSIETGAVVEWLEEDAYFFRLSAYKDRLLAWYASDPHCIQPEGRLNEIRSFVAAGLKDLCITRTNFDWGVKIPSDPKHVLYVWVDALSNYLTPAPDGSPLWPAAVQIVGKDILRFHACIFPAFLMAGGYELPKRIFAHGWLLTENGHVMSKSAGNALDPATLLEHYDADIIRYYLFRDIPFGSDGYCSLDRIKVRYEELANKLGNLVNRVSSMCQKYNVTFSDFKHEYEYHHLHEYLLLYERLQFHEILSGIVKDMDKANAYLQDQAPWAKDKTDLARTVILQEAAQRIYNIAKDLSPFMPLYCAKITDSLEDNTKPWSIPILFPKDKP